MSTSRRLLMLVIAVGVLCVPVRASDFVGIYALVDRVVLEPNAENPTAVQIWGVFALAEGSGSRYRPAERGYLYYSINPSNERATRAEWSDLRAVAGKGQAIGLAQRYKPLGRLRRAGEAPAQPDTYPLGIGLQKVIPEYLGPTVARDLQRVPKPIAPDDGGRVKPGRVSLVVATLPDPNVRYVFEIESASGARETSQPLAPAPERTAWSPALTIERGARYTWRVWAVESSWRGPAASATFVGGE